MSGFIQSYVKSSLAEAQAGTESDVLCVQSLFLSSEELGW